jgi:hypothetical protein
MDKGDKVSVITPIKIDGLRSFSGHQIGELTITPEAVGTIISKLLPAQSDVDWVPKIEFVISKGLTTFIETSNLKIISEDI